MDIAERHAMLPPPIFCQRGFVAIERRMRLPADAALRWQPLLSLRRAAAIGASSRDGEAAERRAAYRRLSLAEARAFCCARSYASAMILLICLVYLRHAVYAAAAGAFSMR